ncbi:MAG: transposase, partial [Coprobacter fastidiosus]
MRISWLFCIFRYSPEIKVWHPKWGKFLNQDMAKIQNISEIHP